MEDIGEFKVLGKTTIDCGLQVPEALDDICLAELVHHSKGADHSVEFMRKRVDDGHAGKII